MKKINFADTQKFAKTLMVVIAAMPAAGISIAIGKSLAMMLKNYQYLAVPFTVLESAGWVIIGNLAILFAVAIGGSWAKEKAGGAFSALIVYLVLLQVTSALAQVGMSADGLLITLPFIGNVEASGYLSNQVGVNALNISVFGGIISGFVGAIIYNKFYNFKKLPTALAFFNGKRFVPFVALFAGMILGTLFFIFWPPVQGVINEIGVWLTTVTTPFIAPFIYGTLERLFLPFGLHHLLTIPMNYTPLGGEYVGICTDALAQGQEYIWFAWMDDLSCALDNQDNALYNTILDSVTPARFKVGQVITSTFTLPMAALAMFSTVDADKKKKYAGFYFGALLPVFLTGITEPIEFLFIFISPVLWLVHAVYTGIAFALSDFIDLRIHAFGLIEVVAKIPWMATNGLIRDVINLMISGLVMGGLYFVTFRTLILKLNIAIPGRNKNYPIEDEDTGEKVKFTGDEQIIAIYDNLGTNTNIIEIDACMTRLRVTVRDIKHVSDEETFKKLGAIGMVVKDNGVQIIFGPKADTIKSDLQDYVDSL